ncbi:hypothetical protein MSI_21910 [Treponema sp. JC4]|nr:hypothetical protein [Treponema sp. JC4]EID84358.1 hypothetical protein MSI_21910 [Treponema sp. JC4]
MFGKKKSEKKAGGESIPLAPARKRSSATPSPKVGSAPAKQGKTVQWTVF